MEILTKEGKSFFKDFSKEILLSILLIILLAWFVNRVESIKKVEGYPTDINWLTENKVEFKLINIDSTKRDVNCRLKLPLPSEQVPIHSKPRFLKAIKSNRMIILYGRYKDKVLHSNVWY